MLQQTSVAHLVCGRHRLEGGCSRLFLAECLASRLGARIPSTRGRKARAAAIFSLQIQEDSSAELTPAGLTPSGLTRRIPTAEAQTCVSHFLSRSEKGVLSTLLPRITINYRSACAPRCSFCSSFIFSSFRKIIAEI